MMTDLMPPALDLTTTVAAQPPEHVAEHVRRSAAQIAGHIRRGAPYLMHVTALVAFIEQFPIPMRPALTALWMRAR